MSLEKLFGPSSIAIIGATPKKTKVGYAILKNILSGGYKGRLFLVNPKHREIEGIPCYKSVLDIKEKVDLAIIVIPISFVPNVMIELGKKKIKSAVIISAGGKEIGEKGAKIEEEIKNIAKKYKIRFLGPNCFGFINTSIDLNANFGSSMPLKGETAFVSQSGALFSSILDWAINENIGFSYCVSTGNMADIEFGELIKYLSSKKNVKRILIYMENVADAWKFVNYSKGVSTKIPVVVTKSGKTEAGTKAAMSHTGALGGKDFLYTACFKRLGFVRADTVELMFDITEALSKQPVPEKNRFAILTNAGGPGVLAADRLGYWDLKPAILSDETLNRLNSILPPNWSKGNPVDILGDATPQRYVETLQILLDAGEVDGIIGVLTPQFMTKPYKTAKEVVKVIQSSKTSKPFYFSIIGGKKVEKARKFLEKSGIATYSTPEEAVDSMVLTHRYSFYKKLLKTDKNEKPRFSNKSRKDIVKNFLKEGKNVLSVYDGKQLLKAYEIPVNETYLIKDLSEIDKLSKDLKFPVVVKVQSPSIIHKKEAGGVIVDVSSLDDLKEAFNTVIKNALSYNPEAKIEGVVIEEMVEEGFELILGSSRDSIFKQYIIFGFGGTFIEFFKDVSFGFPPLTKNFARLMIKDTKIYKILKNGFRNIPPANLDKLEDILIKFSYLLKENPQIEEIDINPIIVTGDKIFAVDCRVKLTKKSEKHLIFN